VLDMVACVPNFLYQSCEPSEPSAIIARAGPSPQCQVRRVGFEDSHSPVTRRVFPVVFLQLCFVVFWAIRVGWI
jgi:hypothetical protein